MASWPIWKSAYQIRMRRTVIRKAIAFAIGFPLTWFVVAFQRVLPMPFVQWADRTERRLGIWAGLEDDDETHIR